MGRGESKDGQTEITSRGALMKTRFYVSYIDVKIRCQLVDVVARVSSLS